ncbi:MAG: flagellar protein FliT [Burkholderiales bacterium]
MSDQDVSLEVNDSYQRALDLTEQMLDAAQKADWDRLVQVERVRGRLLDHLRDNDQATLPTHEVALKRRDIIQSILARDEQIKTLTHDWMHELRDILSSATAQRLLNRTYNP